jgi:3-oxoacyl-[acyl-carrier-protein] synthase II
LRRVVIIGMGAVSPFGLGREDLWKKLAAGKSAVSEVDWLRQVKGLRTHLAAVVPEFDVKIIPRKQRRFMSRMSMYTILAAQEAIAQAGLELTEIKSSRVGVVAGSIMSSAYASQSYFEEYLFNGDVSQIKTSLFFQVMGHSIASNLAQMLGVSGRVLAPASACATGLQAIGLAYEMIAQGVQDIVVCGGADELHPLTVGTFDVMDAASTGFSQVPQKTPRPFDSKRDGVVCAEGAGIVILQELQAAREKGAPILAEITGYSCNCNPGGVAVGESESMTDCMMSAISQAGLNPRDLDYINAHATGTRLGDIAEGRAIESLIGSDVLISSLKGHMGHTLGASGALELVASVLMIQNGVLIGTRNLDLPDEKCGGLHYLIANKEAELHNVLTNSFAMGGVNTAMVLRRLSDESR